MVSRSRRILLQTAGAALAGLAGCLDATGLDTATESPTDSPRPTSPPPNVRTPPSGECSAHDLPKPETHEGLPAPKAYPDGPPSMDSETVRSFLKSYEKAAAFNGVLAHLAEEGDCVETLYVHASEVTLRRAGPGYEATVKWGGYYTGTNCPGVGGTDTPTPPPHADLWDESRYYVTERFLLREGTTVECWE